MKKINILFLLFALQINVFGSFVQNEKPLTGFPIPSRVPPKFCMTEAERQQFIQDESLRLAYRRKLVEDHIQMQEHQERSECDRWIRVAEKYFGPDATKQNFDIFRRIIFPWMAQVVPPVVDDLAQEEEINA